MRTDTARQEGASTREVLTLASFDGGNIGQRSDDTRNVRRIAAASHPDQGVSMAHNAAITIAVGNLSMPGSGVTFPPLPGAYEGAREFGDWAQSQGFVVESFSDENGSVSFTQIFDHVDDLVTAGGVGRLFMYFAGHGINIGGGDDVWLLSRALRNSNEAINVARTVRDARRCGIPHIALFSDACRTAPDRALLNVQGSSMFPVCNIRIRGNVEVDQFYATSSGDAAWERHPDDPTEPPHGIFSACLMPALRGEVDAVVESVDDGDASEAVLAKPLARYLLRAVPSAAQAKVNREQWPDVSASSVWRPDVLAWISRDRAPAPTTPIVPLPDPPPLDKAPGFATEVSQNLETVGRSNFETRAGLSVPHEALMNTIVAGGDEGVFEEFDAWHVRGHAHTPASALLRLPDGPDGDSRWAATAILPGYIGTLRVSKNGVEQTSYLPAPGTLTELGVEHTAEAAARAGAAARRGRLDLAEPLIETAWRVDLNPTVVLLAAYALHRAGALDEVRELEMRFARRHDATLFDLVLLAELDTEAGPPIVPDYPLMTRGWSLLDELPAGQEVLNHVRSRLAAVPWTSPVGVNELAVTEMIRAHGVAQA